MNATTEMKSNSINILNNEKQLLLQIAGMNILMMVEHNFQMLLEEIRNHVCITTDNSHRHCAISKPVGNKSM